MLHSRQIADLETSGSLEPPAVNDMDNESCATPAISKGRIDVRTRSVLYCFGEK